MCVPSSLNEVIIYKSPQITRETEEQPSERAWMYTPSNLKFEKIYRFEMILS